MNLPSIRVLSRIVTPAALDLWPTVFGSALLLVVLAAAIVRPWGLPEAAVAIPAAALAVLTGLVGAEHAGSSVRALGPTLGFLAAVLVLAHLMDLDGVFRWLGHELGRRSAGSPVRLLGWVFALASLTTAVLSLDATVVLLTPVVLVTVRRAGVASRPSLYATAHLSNSASLLLPVSNLTNLLAYGATGLTFLHFTLIMAAPWLVAVAAEYLIFRWFFRADLQERPAATTQGPSSVTGRPPATPVFALTTLAAVLAGFAAGPALGVDPAWVAAAGALVLGVRAVSRGLIGPLRILWEANPLFLAFVAALSVVVDAATDHGLETALAAMLPSEVGLGSLLALAGVAAVLANLVNNLPATLVLLAALGPQAPPALLLAVLIGVNLGPNLTYTGSLATLLWRRVLHRHQKSASLATFTRLGLLTVPVSLVGATAALWVSLQLFG